MSDLYWPGSERADGVLDDAALLAALVRVEAAWLAVLPTAGIAPPEAASELADLVGPADLAALARAAEAGGNPVIPLVDLLRERLRPTHSSAAHWLHRGLTSQDTLDSALMVCLADALDRLLATIDRQLDELCRLARAHTGTVMAGRTLGQYAVPVTFGLRVAAWLTGILDAADSLRRVRGRLPVQCGGAAGTAAAVTELAAIAGAPDPAAVAVRLGAELAERLDLAEQLPWHTVRRPVTDVADALVGCADAWGHIANDVISLSRPEVGELAEGAPGGSSTMPGKQNPVLSALIRRAALSAPALAAQLHQAAAGTVDDRAAGEWHSEWAALRGLARVCLVAAAQTEDLLRDLRVFPDAMRRRVDASLPALLAELHSIRRIAGAAEPADGTTPEHYLGASHLFVQAVLERAVSERATRVPESTR